jgi:hypothetical protein
LRAILEARGTRVPTSAREIELALAEFDRLSKPTAARVLRFWQVRQSAKVQTSEAAVPA